MSSSAPHDGASTIELTDPVRGDTGEALSVVGVTVRYGATTALDDLDLSAMDGQVTAVIGPNGSGKTTFLNAVTGAVPITAGVISVFGATMEKLTPGHVHRMGISRTFQNLELVDDLTVEDNVRLGAKSATTATAFEAALRLPRSFAEARRRHESALAALEAVGIPELSATRVSALSYGTRRRVEVARALAGDPRVLLLDEPTAGMGPADTADFSALIADLRERGLTIVVVEHDMAVVRAVVDKVYVLSAGRLIASGQPADVLQDSEVKRLYLGDLEVSTDA